MTKLILLPGMEGTGELFAPLLAALPSALETGVVAYPRKLLPVSQLDDIVQSILSLEEDYVLLGESFSSPIAIRIASQEPKGLRGLILVGGFASSPVRGWKRIATSMMASTIFGEIVTSASVKTNLIPRDSSDELCEFVRKTIASVPSEVMIQRLRQILATDVTSELRLIKVPVLYMQASKDTLVSADCLQAIQRVKPEIEVAILDTTHLILQAMPNESAAIITTFLDKTQDACSLCREDTGRQFADL